MKNDNKPRILVIDIETLPIEAFVWGLFDQNIGIDMVKQDFTICAFCAKFVGESKVYKFDNRNKANVRDDKALVKKIIALMQSADVLVSQNGIGFDCKKIASRAYFNNIPAYELPQKHVDLLREGRRVFGHTSHKLAWITRKLESSHQKSEHAHYPGFSLWRGVMEGEKAAKDEMLKYCAQDIIATEAVYHDYITWFPSVDLRPFFIRNATNECRACGSCRTTKHGTRRLKNGLFQRWKCSECACVTIMTGQKNNLDKKPGKAK